MIPGGQIIGLSSMCQTWKKQIVSKEPLERLYSILEFTPRLDVASSLPLMWLVGYCSAIKTGAFCSEWFEGQWMCPMQAILKLMLNMQLNGYHVCLARLLLTVALFFI